VNADRSNACRNTADNPAETDGGTSIDPSAAIAARALWSTSVLWQAPPLRKSLFVAHVLRDSSSFRGPPTQKGDQSRNSPPSASWTSRRGCDRDLHSMSAGRRLGAPLGSVFATNSHLAASAGCQNGGGKTPRTNRVVKLSRTEESSALDFQPCSGAPIVPDWPRSGPIADGAIGFTCSRPLLPFWPACMLDHVAAGS
jgi:hypothetical protein